MTIAPDTNMPGAAAMNNRATENAHQQIVKIELGEEAQRTIAWILPTIFVMAFVSAFATAVSVFLIIKYTQAETESRMQEYYTMELDGKLMAAGVIQPKDSWAGRQAEGQLKQGEGK